MTQLLRSLLFYILLSTCTIIAGILGLPLLMFNRQAAVYIAAAWTRIAIYMLAFICKVKVEVKGRESLPPEPFIIAAKHQSAIEPPLIWLLFNNPALIMKKELLWVPIFGPYCLALGMIAIDRKRGVTAIKKLTTKSKAILNSGRSIIIFPEGTRVKTGESPKLRGGIKSIHAIAPETPIIPVAVHSGSSLPKGSFTIIPGKISIHFLPPLEAVTPDTLLTSLHKAINTNCEL